MQSLRHIAGEFLMAHQMRCRIVREAKATQEGAPDLRRDLKDIVPSDVTVVVPCYNHSVYLTQMVGSIAAQTCAPGTVIFMDDCSADDTVMVLQSAVKSTQLELKCPVSILCNEMNLGQAATLNKAIDRTRTPVIMILNDDDYLLHDAIEVETALLHKHEDVVMLGGLGINFDNDRWLSEQRKSILEMYQLDDIEVDLFKPADAFNFKHPNDLNMIHSGSTFLRSAWEVVGGYRTEKGSRVVPFSDRDFQIRVSLRFPVGIARVPVSFWRSTSSVDAGVNS